MATLSVGGTTVFDGSALQSGVTGDISGVTTFPAGHMLQSNYTELTWVGDHSMTSATLWSEDDTLELTLKRANTKVLCYASTGDILINDGAIMHYYFFAKVGAGSLSNTGNSGHTVSDTCGLTRRDSGTTINGPLNMSSIMTLSNSADAVWTFAPAAHASSGDVHTNYSGADGKGVFWIAEIG